MYTVSNQVRSAILLASVLLWLWPAHWIEVNNCTGCCVLRETRDARRQSLFSFWLFNDQPVTVSRLDLVGEGPWPCMCPHICVGLIVDGTTWFAWTSVSLTSAGSVAGMLRRYHILMSWKRMTWYVCSHSIPAQNRRREWFVGWAQRKEIVGDSSSRYAVPTL